MSTLGKLQARLAELLQINEAMVTHIESFASERDYFKNGMAELQDIIDKLEPERDALAARIQAAERVEKIFSETPELTFDDFLKLFADEILEIEAKAGRAGYYSGFKDALVIEPPRPPSADTCGAVDIFAYRVEQTSKCAANQYAERVKAGQA